MGVVIKRSKEDIQKMIDIIQAELDVLPECDAFGDSNEESRKDSKLQIKELKEALDGQLPRDNGSEVYTWLIGKWSTLEDYLS